MSIVNRTEALEEYQKALKLGKAKYKERMSQGQNPNPEVLTEIAGSAVESSIYVGLVEIPAERIVGTKTAGRISAFTADFLPLLDVNSEFANKWIGLCAAHMSEEGIREPIVCYEYLGNFYVQEGNKRVSVLKYFGAPRIPGIVHRVMPQEGDPVRLKAYSEFLEFYKLTRLYTVQFTQPGGYAKLTRAVGIPTGQPWTETETRRFRAYYQYFREAYTDQGGDGLNVAVEDALLLWLEVHEYSELGTMSSNELKKSLAKLWDNVEALEKKAPVVRTEPTPETSGSILQKIISPDNVKVAFIYQRTPAASPWTMAHETGRKYLEEALGRKVQTVSYMNANTPEGTEKLLIQAAEEGADIIFTTTPQMIAPSLKVSVKYPKVKVLNCSVHMPYSTVRTYYSRIYEGKFITGAIAGAMAKNDRIGYVGSYPIHGVPASINAFALGAQLTNPRAKIELKWSCLPGNPTRELFDSGIRVISNRDTPDENRIYTDYGTYFYNEEGKFIPLGSPVWRWGKFYEQVIQSIRSGSFDDKTVQAVNYWWGLKSGVIDVTLTDKLPAGIRYLAELIRSGLLRGELDPFLRKIVDQKGVERCDGIHPLTPDELVKMDWLCDNVIGHIPTLEEVIPESRATVNLLGVFEEDLP